MLCWGKGDFGQLGDNLATSSPVPVRVRGPTKQPFRLEFCRKHQKTLINSYNENRKSKKTASGLGPALAVSAGGLHSCALELDGRAKCWGKGEEHHLRFSSLEGCWAHLPAFILNNPKSYCI